jgi:hypothetical protein
MGAVTWKLKCTEDKQEVNKKKKRKLQQSRGAYIAAGLLLEKTFHCQATLHNKTTPNELRRIGCAFLRISLLNKTLPRVLSWECTGDTPVIL